MKILLLGPGSSIHVRRPLMQLLSQNFEVVFAGQANPLPKGHPNYKYVYYPCFGRCIYRRLGHFLGDFIAQHTFVPLLRRIQKNYQPDITHVHWIDCHAYYCVQANLHPLVLSVWGSDINNCFESNADPVHNQKVGFTLASAEKVIVDSPEMINKCSVLAGHALENIELLHLGINPRLFANSIIESVPSLKRTYQIPPDARVLLSVRGFSPVYQHEKILLAFAQALPALHKKTVLVFKRYNESDKDYYAYILALIKQLGIENSTYWVDQLPDARVPDLYFISDAIINFPAQDTFPVTFLEAAASERPVITIDLPSYENTFASDFFRIAKDDSVEALAKSIFEELEVDPTPRENIMAARRSVETGFSETNYLNRLVNIYKELIIEFTAGGGSR